MEPDTFRAHLKELGLSQPAFAREVYTDKDTVNRWACARAAIPGGARAYLELRIAIHRAGIREGAARKKRRPEPAPQTENDNAAFLQAEKACLERLIADAKPEDVLSRWSLDQRLKEVEQELREEEKTNADSR